MVRDVMIFVACVTIILLFVTGQITVKINYSHNAAITLSEPARIALTDLDEIATNAVGMAQDTSPIVLPLLLAAILLAARFSWKRRQRRLVEVDKATRLHDWDH
jgi:hypothetical protein